MSFFGGVLNSLSSKVTNAVNSVAGTSASATGANTSATGANASTTGASTTGANSSNKKNSNPPGYGSASGNTSPHTKTNWGEPSQKGGRCWKKNRSNKNRNRKNKTRKNRR